jgi:hypothetical protein
MDALRNTDEVKTYKACLVESAQVGKEIIACYPPMRKKDGIPVIDGPYEHKKKELKDAQHRYKPVQERLKAAEKVVEEMPAFKAMCTENGWELWRGLFMLRR